MRNMCAVQRLRKQINYNELKYILKGRDNPLRGFVTNLHKSRGETSLWFQYILLAHCTLADVCENCTNSLPLALSWTVVGRFVVGSFPCTACYVQDTMIQEELSDVIQREIIIRLICNHFVTPCLHFARDERIILLQPLYRGVSGSILYLQLFFMEPHPIKTRWNRLLNSLFSHLSL